MLSVLVDVSAMARSSMRGISAPGRTRKCGLKYGMPGSTSLTVGCCRNRFKSASRSAIELLSSDLPWTEIRAVTVSRFHFEPVYPEAIAILAFPFCDPAPSPVALVGWDFLCRFAVNFRRNTPSSLFSPGQTMISAERPDFKNRSLMRPLSRRSETGDALIFC